MSNQPKVEQETTETSQAEVDPFTHFYENTFLKQHFSDVVLKHLQETSALTSDKKPLIHPIGQPIIDNIVKQIRPILGIDKKTPTMPSLAKQGIFSKPLPKEEDTPPKSTIKPSKGAR